MQKSLRILATATIMLLLFGFAPVSAQTKWSIETTKFNSYLTQDSVYAKIQNRYDVLNRLWLCFISGPDGSIIILVYDYDPGGNMTSKISLSCRKEAGKDYCFICDTPEMKAEEFAQLVQKIMDRLDNKK